MGRVRWGRSVLYTGCGGVGRVVQWGRNMREAYDIRKSPDARTSVMWRCVTRVKVFRAGLCLGLKIADTAVGAESCCACVNFLLRESDYPPVADVFFFLYSLPCRHAVPKSRRQHAVPVGGERTPSPSPAFSAYSETSTRYLMSMAASS